MITKQNFKHCSIFWIKRSCFKKKITNWNEFSDASNVYKDINGDPQKQQYHNPENGIAVTQDKTGYYAVYLRYVENGVTKTVYGVVYVEV